MAAAISPDGKFLLIVLDEKGKQSLWLRNVPTNSDTQVLAPTNASYVDLIFSPDGNYIFFRKLANNAAFGSDLFRAPVLGGTPQPIVRDIDSEISFSADGKRIAFIRANNPELRRFQLLTASADGTDERTPVRRTHFGVTALFGLVAGRQADRVGLLPCIRSAQRDSTG